MKDDSIFFIFCHSSYFCSEFFSYFHNFLLFLLSLIVLWYFYSLLYLYFIIFIFHYFYFSSFLFCTIFIFYYFYFLFFVSIIFIFYHFRFYFFLFFLIIFLCEKLIFSDNSHNVKLILYLFCIWFFRCFIYILIRSLDKLFVSSSHIVPVWACRNQEIEFSKVKKGQKERIRRLNKKKWTI